jgi:hypothetical protein
LHPADIIDGRTIADATGRPVVMLTLSPIATSRLKAAGPTPTVRLDGKTVAARFADNAIEIDGQPDFRTASATALAISGKPPLPDSLDE